MPRKRILPPHASSPGQPLTRQEKLAKRLVAARRVLRSAQAELASALAEWGSVRPWYHCLRCGYDWQGLSPERAPRNCARCHSAGWDTPPSRPRARRPSDAPNPNWGEDTHRAPIALPAPAPAVPIVLPEPVAEAFDGFNAMNQIADDIFGANPIGIARGLPPPPDLRVSPGLPPGLPPPPSLAPPAPAPTLYVPRAPRPPAPVETQEPQPESTARATPPPEPSWEDILPRLSPEFDLACDLGEEAVS